MGKSKQTIGKVKLRGKLYGFGDETSENIGNDDFKRYLTGIRIKTSSDNAHFISSKQWHNGKNKVYLYDNDGNQKVVDWDNRYNFLDSGFKPGYGVNIKKKDGETMKLLEDDFIDFILDEFEDGDDVFIYGDLNFYKNKKGEVGHNIEVKGMFPTTEPIDFDADDFEEMSDFKVNTILKETDIIGDTLFATCFVFDYYENPIEIDFEVDNNRDKELTKYLEKKLDYGDAFSVEGDIHNRVVYSKLESNSGVGRKKKTFKNNNNNKYEIESERHALQIQYLDGVTKELYTPDDIAKLKKSEEEEKQEKKKKQVDKAKKNAKKKSGGVPW